jgi:aspartate aminotransferase
MFKESNKLLKINESPTLAASKKAKELKALGLDIIDLTVGEPDFNLPEHIKNASKKALDDGKTKYTPVDGTIGLKQAIKSKLKRENNLEYSLDQIIVGSGAKHVIFNVLMAILNEGDEVIIPSPYWVSYPDMTILSSGTPVFIECTQENGFKLLPDQLRKSISRKTKLIILNSPSNPTGSVYSYDELKEIANVLLEFPDIWILSDDIYEHLIYDSKKFFNILNVENKLFNRTIIVNGGSKAFAMTGLRIGYAACENKDLINSMSKIQSHSTSNPSSISQYALEFALNSSIDFLEEWKKIYQRRRDLAINILTKSKYLKISKENASGAFYLFVNCENLIRKKAKITSKTSSKKEIVLKNDADISEFLLIQSNVSVVLGAAFGLSPYFRISYALSDETLKIACERIVFDLDKNII